MKLSPSNESLREPSVQSSHPQTRECLTALLSSKSNLDKATQAELTGYICRINGKDYVLNRDKLVFDIQTKEVVFDSRIYEKVLDRYEETKAIINLNRRNAIRLAKGDPAKEEAIRMCLISTRPQEPWKSDVQAA